MHCFAVRRSRKYLREILFQLKGGPLSFCDAYKRSASSSSVQRLLRRGDFESLPWDRVFTRVVVGLAVAAANVSLWKIPASFWKADNIALWIGSTVLPFSSAATCRSISSRKAAWLKRGNEAYECGKSMADGELLFWNNRYELYGGLKTSRVLRGGGSLGGMVGTFNRAGMSWEDG